MGQPEAADSVPQEYPLARNTSSINNMEEPLYDHIKVQNQAFMQLKLFYDAEYF